MKVKIGIPRALVYYEYFPLWKTFFEELGTEVVLSDKTTKILLNDGVSHSVDEACLPVKLFHGHVINLKNKVDYLFIPRLKSVAKGEYICPKFIGLPEMLKFSIKDLPPFIDTEINLRKTGENLFKSFEKIGKMFVQDRKKIADAYHIALEAQQNFVAQQKEGKYPVEILEGRKYEKLNKPSLKIALIGHVYNIYDQYISMNIISKLQNKGVEVITPELIDDDLIEEKVEGLRKKMFWTSGKKLMGATLHLLDRQDIDGIVYLMSFGCGVDAFISDLCERRVRRETNIPFCLLSLDEHTGEAGFNTRLEAFVDMIKWRKRDEGYISAHG